MRGNPRLSEPTQEYQAPRHSRTPLVGVRS